MPILSFNYKSCEKNHKINWEEQKTNKWFLPKIMTIKIKVCGMTNIKEVNIGDDVSMIEYAAFSGCSSISSVSWRNNKT